MSTRIRNPKIAEMVFNTPLLVEPKKAAAVMWALNGRIGDIGSITDGTSEIDPRTHTSRAGSLAKSLGVVPDGFKARLEERDILPFDVVQDIAIIPVEGTLVHKGKWVGASSGETSYEGISTAVRMAAEDDRINGIVLEVDSFGGTAQGLFDLVDQIFEARQQKPIWSILTENAASAGYAIASAADRIVMPRTGMAGSIGVLLMHVDFSRMLDEKGITVTLIEAGEHKADGNQFEPLPDTVRDELQDSLDATWDIFIRTVARNRPTLTVAAIRDMQAAIFDGQEAVDVGLVDEIAAPLDAFNTFAGEVDTRRRPVINVIFRSSDDQDDEMADAQSLPHIVVAEAPGPSEPGQLAGRSAVTQKTEDDSMSDQSNGSAEHPVESKPDEQSTQVAVDAAVSAERKRVAELEDMRMPGNEAVISAAIREGKSPGDVARELVAAEKAKQAAARTQIGEVETELDDQPVVKSEVLPAAPSTTGGVQDVKQVQHATDEERWDAEWKANANSERSEFVCFDSFKAFKEAERDGRCRVLRTK